MDEKFFQNLISEETLKNVQEISRAQYDFALKTTNLKLRYTAFRYAKATANIAKEIIRLQELEKEEGAEYV